MMETYEIEELACLMLGKDYNSLVDNDEIDIIYDEFLRKYDIPLGGLYNILIDLEKFTPTWKSYIKDLLLKRK